MVQLSWFSLVVALILFGVLSSEGQKRPPSRVIHRPGKSPLRCFNENGVSRCEEIRNETVQKEKVDDPHDLETGPLGGKLYKVGDSMMECFPNGQCFEVKEVTTPAPTPEPPAGIYYRRGNTFLECFPNGECEVIDIVDPANEETEYEGDYESDGSEEGAGEDKGGARGPGEEGGPDGGVSGGGGPDGGGPNEGGPNGGGPNGGGPNGGGPNGGGPNGGGPSRGGEIGDHEPDRWSENREPGQGRKAVCEFKNSVHVQGGIILLEEKTQSRMQVIGKLRGLREGIHVLTFHSASDVDSPGCRGVGPYHRPTVIIPYISRRRRRQIELFKLGEKYMTSSYDTCIRHVESCKQRKLSPATCATYMKNCVPVLKCKNCKEKGNSEETYDTIGDMEDSGQFKFQSGVPRSSLTIYADDDGESNFKEEEREQSLHGPDSVIGRSIVLSALPKDPTGDFRGIACCQILEGGPTIIV